MPYYIWDLKGDPNLENYPHLAPILLWHLGQGLVVPRLERLCDSLWKQPDTYFRLRADSWLICIPKPGKPADSPANLRPISSTEGGGRVVVKALTARLRPHFTDAKRLWPQFAYLPGRGIDHAIARALRHCDEVQAMLAG